MQCNVRTDSVCGLLFFIYSGGPGKFAIVTSRDRRPFHVLRYVSALCRLSNTKNSINNANPKMDEPGGYEDAMYEDEMEVIREMRAMEEAEQMAGK